MSYNPNNPNGQATMANSSPVAISSNQSAIPVKNQDGAGTSINSLGDGASSGALIGLGASIIATNFVLSSGNSSTAQLAASATFTGTIETIYNQQAVSILLTSDQNGTLTLKQYIDSGGTRLISSWAITVAAGTPFSRSFTANGNYFNLTFQNTGGSTTTTLNISTAYGTLPNVTNLGNSNVALNEVNGTAITLGQKAMSASLPVVLSSDQAAIPITDNSGSLTVDAPVGTPVFARLSDGSAALIGQKAMTASLPVTLASDQSNVNVVEVPATSGGWSIFHAVSANSTNATNIKASAGQVGGWFIYNNNALARKVVFHNTAGTPTAGASVIFSIVIPPNSASNVEWGKGLPFATGIAITAVTGIADSDATAVALNDLVINIFYK